MKIVETLNKTLYWAILWVTHTVFDDWNKVYSYEWLTPFSKRKYKIYSSNEYYKKTKEIIKEKEIPPIEIYEADLPHYAMCYDFIEYHWRKNWIDVREFTTNRLKDKAMFAFIKFVFYLVFIIIIPLIIWIITYYVWINVWQGRQNQVHKIQMQHLQEQIPTTLQQCWDIFNYDIIIE